MFSFGPLVDLKPDQVIYLVEVTLAADMVVIHSPSSQICVQKVYDQLCLWHLLYSPTVHTLYYIPDLDTYTQSAPWPANHHYGSVSPVHVLAERSDLQCSLRC